MDLHDELIRASRQLGDWKRLLKQAESLGFTEYETIWMKIRDELDRHERRLLQLLELFRGES